MDTNKKLDKKESNFGQTSKWKSTQFRRKVVKRIIDTLIQQRSFSPEISFSDIAKKVERFEGNVNATAKSEDEYIARVTAKLKEICEMPQNTSTPEVGTKSNEELQEQTYQKVQNLKSKYFSMLNAHYQRICNKLRVVEASAQESRTIDLEKLRHNKKILELIFTLFRASKSKIAANFKDFKDRVDEAEKVIHYIQNINVSSSQGKPSTDVQPNQQLDSSCPKISSKDNEVGVQFLTTKQVINQPLFTKDTGNVVQQQTHCTPATEASGVNVNNSIISASPLVFDQDPGPAMQRLIKAYTTISPEADMGEVSMSAFVDEMSQMEQHESQPSLNPKGWKMCRSFDAVTFDIPKVKRPRIDQVCQKLFEEMKEVNNLLIDSEVVISEIENKIGVAAENNEGLVVKFKYNAVTINQAFISHITTDKKLLIKPLWLLVPTSYPLSSPVILENMSLEASEEDLLGFSKKAKEMLRTHLQSMDQPWSLKDMAISWDRLARKTILEYAHAQGGGTFSSLYGEWENCVDFD